MAQRELDELEGRVLGQRSTLREARVTRKQTRLSAPFDGVVGAREIRVGEVATSSTQAFTIVDLDALLVVASLPERDVSRIQVGQAARAISAYDPDSFAEAHVERVAPIIDAATGTFRVQLRLAEDQRALRPGQFVSVSIEVDRHDDVVVIPKRALVYEDGVPVVYRMIRRELDDEELAQPKPGASPGGRSLGCGSSLQRGGQGPPTDKAPTTSAESVSPYVAERVGVEVGLIDEVHAEIRQGIEVGDDIVVLGQSALRDGARIRTPDMEPETSRENPETAEPDGGEPG